MEVSFPGLGLTVTVDNVAFTIGNFEVYWYGVLIGVSLLLGLIFCMICARKFGVDFDRMLDVIIIGAVLAVICGRLYYVLFSGHEYKTFKEIIDLRSGGIAMYGVLFGAFVGAFIGCKLRKVRVLPMFDMAGISFMLASTIGRWGNFINQEAFGGNTDLPWGMISSRTISYLTSRQAELAELGMIVDPSLPVHPTFLYECIWTLIGWVFLICFIKRRKFDGQLFLMYTLWYGIGRAFVEGLRTDSLYIGPFRVSQLVGALLAIFSLAALITILIIKKKKPGFMPVYAETEECDRYFELLAQQRAAKDKKHVKQVEEENPAPEQKAEEPTDKEQ